MEDKTVLGVCAIGALTALEIVALIKGMDGIILSAVMAAITGIATGVTVHQVTKRRMKNANK